MEDKITDTIWSRRGKLDRARQNKMQELMDEYDKTVYYPAKKALIRECFQEGHRGDNFHSNGFGWHWFYCQKCGGRYNIQGPDDQKSKDDGDWDS